MTETPEGSISQSGERSKLPGGFKVAGAGCGCLVVVLLLILFVMWLIGYLPPPLANWYENVGP